MRPPRIEQPRSASPCAVETAAHHRTGFENANLRFLHAAVPDQKGGGCQRADAPADKEGLAWGDHGVGFL